MIIDNNQDVNSIYYLLKTRTIGTPFRDSLTQEQLMIKMVASEVRSRIFLNGVLLGGLLLIYFRPFQSCSCANPKNFNNLN